MRGCINHLLTIQIYERETGLGLLEKNEDNIPDGKNSFQNKKDISIDQKRERPAGTEVVAEVRLDK